MRQEIAPETAAEDLEQKQFETPPSRTKTGGIGLHGFTRDIKKRPRKPNIPQRETVREDPLVEEGIEVDLHDQPQRPQERKINLQAITGIVEALSIAALGVKEKIDDFERSQVPIEEPLSVWKELGADLNETEKMLLHAQSILSGDPDIDERILYRINDDGGSESQYNFADMEAKMIFRKERGRDTLVYSYGSGAATTPVACLIDSKDGIDHWFSIFEKVVYEVDNTNSTIKYRELYPAEFDLLYAEAQ